MKLNLNDQSTKMKQKKSIDPNLNLFLIEREEIFFFKVPTTKSKLNYLIYLIYLFVLICFETQKIEMQKLLMFLFVNNTSRSKNSTKPQDKNCEKNKIA
jgi:hypothetical protein